MIAQEVFTGSMRPVRDNGKKAGQRIGEGTVGGWDKDV
jgi:hypothetical protein